MKQLLGLFALAAAALPTAAQDYSYGRIRHVEGGTTLQRASEPGAEEAFRNLPFFPGDRIWTDETGRAEFQFGAGGVVRLDERSKLDYMANDGERGASRVVLRLWSGALLIRSRDGRSASDFEVETPGGLVLAGGDAIARIDVSYGETRLSVYQGTASLDDGQRRVRLAAGEMTSARRGEEPAAPQRFDRRQGDAFARWDEERERQIDWASAEDGERSLPEEVAPYAADLRSYGSWRLDAEIGYVWRPHVAAGWRPYLDGRWVWSAYGWTWVPNEIWGWAPFHYGRWGHSVSLGWYWIPGRAWSPAWVSWSYGNDYIGWCPLGRGDRPAVVSDSRVFGHAVARGPQGSPWTYARRGDLAARDLARRRVDVPQGDAERQHVVERGHIDRNLRVVEGDRRQPRNVQLRPTPGDTIPELRADPMTTIPFPVVRRRYASEDERREREGRDRSRTRFEEGPAQAQQNEDQARRRDGAAEVRTPERERTPSSWIERRRAAETTADRSSSAAAERDRTGERSDRPSEKAEREGERPDRDVLRRVFRPLSSGTRDRDRGDGESKPRDGGETARARPRETPRDTAAPAPRGERQGSSREGDGSTARRKKNDR